MNPIVETDVLVIGGGGAGFRAAIGAAEKGAKVTLLSKGPLARCGASPMAGADFTLDGNSMSQIDGLTGDPNDTPDPNTAGKTLHARIFTEILKKGYPATRRRYEDGPSIEPGETLVLDLEFPRTFSLAGFVKSVDGKIVEGAQVRYGTIGIATSDEFGKFRIENIDSSVLKREVHPRLMTSAPGFVTDEKTLHLDGKTANFDDIDVVLHE